MTPRWAPWDLDRPGSVGAVLGGNPGVVPVNLPDVLGDDQSVLLRSELDPLRCMLDHRDDVLRQASVSIRDRGFYVSYRNVWDGGRGTELVKQRAK